MEQMSFLVYLERMARLELHGLRAKLRVAVAEAPEEDPARARCQDLLAELDRLIGDSPVQASLAGLGSVNSLPAPTLPPVSPVKAKPSVPAFPSQKSLTSHLLPLVQSSSLGKEASVRRFLGNTLPSNSQDAALWSELQHLGLRLPPQEARAWQEHLLELAQQAGAQVEEVDGNAQILPLHRNEWVYPGLSNSTVGPGLKASSQCPHPSLGDWPEEKDLFVLAGVVSAFLHMLQLDMNLHHALKDLYRFGLVALDEENRSLYADELIRRFRRVLDVRNDPVQSFHARLDLDEAIHSLVHSPPADSHSWWGCLKQEARQTLVAGVENLRQGKIQAHVQELLGRYASIHRLTKSDDNLELDQGGELGEVIGCLRVYAEIETEGFPGRVIYRSSR